MDPELLRKAREAIDNFPPRPDLDQLIEIGAIAKVTGGYRALTEAGRKAIEKYATSIIAPTDGGSPIYRLKIRRKRNS